MTKRALVTGITGQDGAYLAEFLLENDYEVFGSFRRSSSVNFWRLEELGIKEHPNLSLVDLDLTDAGNCITLIKSVNPDEVYNLAAQSFVKLSFEQPITTGQITALGALNLLEAIRFINPEIRFYQASTSEMFGKIQETPQTENTPFYPRSPYGIAKLYAHWMTVNYKESYDIFATSGILFNHESQLRGEEFVTRKISLGVAKIKYGVQECLELGNLDALRDWGFAGEYIQGMWKMLQVEHPDTYVLATNRAVKIREFLQLAFDCAGLNVAFEGEGKREIAIDKRTNKTVMKISPKFYRPAEVDLLQGDASKAKKELGWEAKTTLEKLCESMVEADLRRAKKQFVIDK